MADVLSEEPTSPDRFRRELRIAGVLLLGLVLAAAPTLMSPAYAKRAVGYGLLWPLEFEHAGGGHPVHLAIGLALGLIVTFGRDPFASAAALLAGLWGLFAVTVWFSPMGVPFAICGGIGFAGLLATYFPRSPRWLQSVTAPAVLLFLGSRAYFAAPYVLPVIWTPRYESSQLSDRAIHCDDTLDRLCAPGIDLDGHRGGSIAVLSSDGSVSLWDRQWKKCWQRPSNRAAAVAFPLIRFTSDGSHLLLVFAEDAVLLDSATGENVAALEAPREGALDDRAFAIVGREIVSAGPAWTFYDDSTGAIRESAPSGCGVASAVAPASTAGRFWAACGERVLLWDRKSGEERTVETFAPEARVLSIGGAGADRTVLGQVVLPETPSAVWRFSEDPAASSVDLHFVSDYPIRQRQALRFDSQGRVAFPYQGGGRVLDTRRGNRWELLKFDAPPIQAMAWGEGEDWVLVLTTDIANGQKGQVHRWEVKENEREQAGAPRRNWSGGFLVK